MPKMTSWIRIVSVVAITAVLYACSNANSGTPIVVDSSGNHPAEWLDQHWISFRQTLPGTAKVAGKNVTASAADLSASPCAECHGSDLSGGISKVSCFSARAQNGQACHATGPVTGSHGWKNDSDHGKSGAMAAPGVSSGFAYCVRCHGNKNETGINRYKGNVNIGDKSCMSSNTQCHSTAPHPPKPWIGVTISHATTSPENAAECFQCHANGNNFGPVLVSAPLSTSPPAPKPDCFNNTLCHGGNVNPPHAKSAAYLAASQHGIDAAGKNSANPELSLASCKTCHAGATARFNLPTNNMANGCETCHAANTAHPTPWLPGRAGTATEVPTPNKPNNTTHATVPVVSMTTGCVICHGAALDGVGGNGAPSCMSSTAKFGISCHATSPVANPTGCTSCHATPPSGTTAPNRQFNHGTHTTLPSVTCDACHLGLGFGTANHADGTRIVNLSPAFQAKTLATTFGYDAATGKCSGISCHGGQLSPDWKGAPIQINVSTDCLKCHAQGTAPQAPQFNSFFSGLFNQVIPAVNLHQFHLQQNNPFTGSPLFCTDCHSSSVLTTQQHFGGLATPSFEGASGDTIVAPRITGGYDKTIGRCSGVTCHLVAPQTLNWGL